MSSFLLLLPHGTWAVVVPWFAVLAADTGPTGTPDPLSVILSTGVLGAVFLLILTGQLVPGTTHRTVLNDNTRYREMIEKMLPALDQSSRSNEAATKLIQDMALELKVRDVEANRPGPVDRRRRQD